MQYMCGSASCDKKFGFFLNIVVFIFVGFIILILSIGATIIDLEKKSQNNDINVQTSKVSEGKK